MTAGTSDPIQSMFERGHALHNAGKLQDAIECYQRVIERQPNHHDALNLLGVAYHQLGDNERAIPFLQRVVELHPNVSGFRSNYGELLRQADRVEEAMPQLERAIELDPANAGALSNYGGALTTLGRFDEALAYLKESFRLERSAVAAQNIGNIFIEQLRISEAMEWYRESARISPDYVGVQMNIAVLYLLVDEYVTGFKHYEWRWKLPYMAAIRARNPGPRWEGEDLAGNRIFIHAEQGLGDSINFIRYARHLKERGATVIFGAQKPIVRLMQSCPWLDEITEQGQPLPNTDFVVAMMSLPRLFETTFDTIPWDGPYLSAVEETRKKWGERIAPYQRQFKVGISWAGSKAHKKDRHRSINLQKFADWSKLSGVTFFSLQKGDDAAQARDWPVGGAQLIDWTSDIQDMADTAGLLEHLDLVVSVDTAVIHLAGAMNREVWTLLPMFPDYRWGIGRDHCDWYPSMRLFRQPRFLDWHSVIRRVGDALRERARPRES